VAGMLSVVVPILVLGILIFVHELGHFLVAKWRKVGVLEFAIGFGPRVWSKRAGETTYSVRAIPLGGFVRMVGDDPHEVFGTGEKSDAREKGGQGPAQEELDEIDRKLLADKSRWFLTKGFWSRAAIVLAGPGFNFLFAVVLSVASYAMFGKPVKVDSAIVGDVMPNLPAQKAGLKALDRVISIDGKAVTQWDDLAKTIQSSGGKPMVFHIQRPRDGTLGGPLEDLDLTVVGTAENAELNLLDGKRVVRIGIVPYMERMPVNLLEAVKLGSLHTWAVCELTMVGLYGMVRGAISPKQLAGPLFIVGEAARSAQRGGEALLSFIIFLSVSLAILNLLPIPILDGGHLLFFTIEAVKGTPVSLRVQERAMQFGMAVLLLLMLVAVSNDIRRMFFS
jgi:regulator of sigma E protease